MSTPYLTASQSAIDFGAVPASTTAQAVVNLSNLGALPLTLESLAFVPGTSGSSEAFTASLAGTAYAGGTGSVLHPLSLALQPLDSVDLTVTFDPADETLHEFTLELVASSGTVVLPVSGIGGHEGHPFLHLVAEVPELVVDYDGDGYEEVLLDGMQSHTHEPGHALIGYSWQSLVGFELASGPLASVDFPVGDHLVKLVISDDNVPSETLTATETFRVVPPDAIPGVRARYYDAGAAAPADLLSAVPLEPDHAEVLEGLAVSAGSSLGGSALTGNAMVQLDAGLVFDGGTYELMAVGGSGHFVGIDGVPVSGPVTLSGGQYTVEVRWAVETLADLPLELHLSEAGGSPQPIDPVLLTHSEVGMPPVINSMPQTGSTVGGNLIDVSGLGFHPVDDVRVHWGGQVLTPDGFHVASPELLRFESPAGTGSVAVRVETPQGFSNTVLFTYDETAPVPIYFNLTSTEFFNEPITGEWGPDGRFYMALRSGKIVSIEYDDSYYPVPDGIQVHKGVSKLPNSTVLGLTFNPHDPPGVVRIYVAHSALFAQGGLEFTGPSPYPGQVSVLEGPDFDAPQPIITGLPTSNHDHGVNGIVFDNNGDLLICVGGNTNAGVKLAKMGDLDESPLSAAILKAELSRPDFNGAITYVETDTGLPNDDQVYGGSVDVAPGVHVYPFATGLRSAFDLVYTTNRRIYATDNGPNATWGAASTGPDTEGPHPNTDSDELLLVERGNYYGHPNRNRGRYDPRQNVYRGLDEPAVLGEFSQSLTDEVFSSSNGICEYRATAFGGQLRGQLLVQRWTLYQRRVELSADGREVLEVQELYPWTGGLDLATGPGGALLAVDQNGNALRAFVPSDYAAAGVTVYDVTPWRAPREGGRLFEIGGAGFGSVENTAVTFDGIPATVVSVTPTRIRGLLPAHPAPPMDLVDVVVTVGGEATTLPAAFRFLGPPGTEPGLWEHGPILPFDLGQVAGGLTGGMLYLVGEGTDETLMYDVAAGAWSAGLAARPHPGRAHSAEVLDGGLFLVGGLQGGSEGKLQIYDPATDSWSLGADLPWAGGSVQTAVIDGLLYAAGGIVGNLTVDSCAVYDPAADAWTPLASMPSGKGRNHAAAGTDGERLFLFGGRGEGSGPGGWLANGFDDVQIYDPASDTWEGSYDPGSPLQALPQARGGMGKAVYYHGEFYVFGGETMSGPGATEDGVYDRVDVYDPLTHTWREEAPMPTPRQGIWPLALESRIFIAGGGVKKGYSLSRVLEVFIRQ